ncbi:MAG: response regulator [Myxococcaceae bacterium]|nr:response regulator [Myxococcaceae bacterium]
MAAERILVVDDNAQNLKLARVLLTSAGYEVKTAVDAADTWRALEQFDAKLVLMDLQLPDLDGLELTRRLKALPRWSKLKVVALTAYAMKGDREKALAAGCDGYVTKPVDADLLLRTVAEQLDGP